MQKPIFDLHNKTPEIIYICCKISCCKAESSIKMQNKQVSYFGTNEVHQRYEVMWKEGKFSVFFSQQGCEKNRFRILPVYVPVMYLCSSRFLVHRKQDALNMRNRGPEAAVCHSTWKASKICQCQICLGWKLCTAHNDASEKSKIKCTLAENLLHIYSQFLPISAVPKGGNFHLCLKHASSVSFIRPTELPPAFVMKVHLDEITEVNKASKIFPLSHREFICWGFIFCNVWLLFLASSTPRHTGDLAFSRCTPGRWWWVLALTASTQQCSLLIITLEQEQPRPRSQAFTLCLEFLRCFSANHTSQL